MMNDTEYYVKSWKVLYLRLKRLVLLRAGYALEKGDTETAEIWKAKSEKLELDWALLKARLENL